MRSGSNMNAITAAGAADLEVSAGGREASAADPEAPEAISTAASLGDNHQTVRPPVALAGDAAAADAETTSPIPRLTPRNKIRICMCRAFRPGNMASAQQQHSASSISENRREYPISFFQ